ncbi:Gastric intrinsic factor, partial [Araneus ventricosus]
MLDDSSSTRELYLLAVLTYAVKGTIECLNRNSFKCDNNSCVPEEKVCDGVKDCKDGADEIGCETGVLSIKGVPEAREKAVSWLKQKRTAAWGWRENTPRAVVALYLASAATFNGTVLEEELMAKQTELKTAVAQLRPSLTNSELGMFINVLLVTCHSPRQFYGNNLVKRLKEQVEEAGNFTHPLAYLALCNANESWPLKAASDINSILSSNSEYPFVKDLQAMALTALSCEANRSRNIDNVLSNATSTLYKKTIEDFKKHQADDGSFGNIYTTALITQALLSSGQEHSKDWKLNATIKHLMKEINSSSIDFLTTYLALPILNGKSLMDISRVNCSANPRKHGDDAVSEINDYLGPKMRVQYSLYIGDEKDVIHTISLRVPENYTASEVMELAEVEDTKYKFEWKTMSGKMYVHEIANVINDPEAGKFWLLYVGAANSSEPLIHLTNGPDEVIMADGERLVL